MDTWGGQLIPYRIRIQYGYVCRLRLRYESETYRNINKSNNSRYCRQIHIRADCRYGPAQLNPDAPSPLPHLLNAYQAHDAAGHAAAQASMQHGRAPPPKAAGHALHHVDKQRISTPVKKISHACIEARTSAAWTRAPAASNKPPPCRQCTSTTVLQYAQAPIQ